MQRKIRIPKITDNEEIEKAINLIYDLMDFNQNIERTLWSSALAFVLIKGFKQSGFTYKEFRNDISQAFDHYEDFFNT